MPARPAGQRMRVLTASLIALTSVLGAVGAWRASLASSSAGDADRKGFADNVARTQQRAAILIQTDAILLDFVRMRAYEDRAEALRTEAAEAGPDDAARLEAQADADVKLAELIRTTIDPDALRPDGSLDLRRKFQLEFRLASGQQDLDPGPDFALADRMKSKAERLVGLTALFIAAALFLTLAQVSRTGAARRTYFAGGLGVLVTATALLFLVEVL
jgi:hypothetical protein